MALDPQHIGSWRAPDLARIASTHATRPVLVARSGAAGSRFHVLTAAMSDTVANSIRRFVARRSTVVADMGSAALATGSVTRTVGSFITDGWRVNDRLIVAGATTLANDAETIVTAVAALTLTVTAASFTAEALPAGSELYRAGQTARSAVAASAGYAAGVAPVDLLATDQPFVDAAPDRQLILGPNSAILAAAGATLTAATFIDLLALGGDY